MAHVVTSSLWPSVKWARTSICCSAPFLRTTCSGRISSRSIRGSLGDGGRLPGGDPFGQHAVFARVDREPQAPFVRNRAGRLEQDQAAAGIGRHDPAAPRLAGDHQEIGLRIVTPQRQLEAVLPRRRAVAGARVAAGFRQHRLHVVAEAPGNVAFVLLDGHCHAGRPPLPVRAEDRLAVGDGNRDRIADPHDFRIARFEDDALGRLADEMSPLAVVRRRAPVAPSVRAARSKPAGSPAISVACARPAAGIAPMRPRLRPRESSVTDDANSEPFDRADMQRPWESSPFG